MIYDRPLWLCAPPEGREAPFQGKLIKRRRCYYGELTVYHRRFWEAQAAGVRVDKMVQIPLGADVLLPCYALLADGHVYRVEEAQPTVDALGLPVVNLTLHRMEGNYDISKPD